MFYGNLHGVFYDKYLLLILFTKTQFSNFKLASNINTVAEVVAR